MKELNFLTIAMRNIAYLLLNISISTMHSWGGILKLQRPKLPFFFLAMGFMHSL